MKLSNRRVLEGLLLGNRGETIEDLWNEKDLKELRSLGRKLIRQSKTKRDKGRVYILPGIMGSTLWGDRQRLPDDWIWISPIDLANGGVKKLKIGSEPNPIYARDGIDIFYLKMKRSLRVAGYDTDYMPYDWRHSPSEIGVNLLEQIKSRGEKNVSLVCHSMGGLLARQMAALDPNKKYIKRVITLGTPNYGSYSPVEIFALTSSTMKFLAKIDREHTEEEIIDKYAKYFTGLLEMMPDKRIRTTEDYYNFKKWPVSGLKPDKKTLGKAKTSKQNLSLVDDRFIQIIGMNEETIQSASIKNDEFQFELNNDGDGTVPRDLAEMGSVDRYYLDGKHRSLLNISKAIKGVKDILASGETNKLRKSPFKSGEDAGQNKAISASKLRKKNGNTPRKDIDKMLDGVIDDRLLV